MDLSPGTFSETPSHAVDPYTLKKFMPLWWRRFLLEQFGGDIDRIVKVFGCDRSTAEKWLSKNHHNNPSGPSVAIAYEQKPDAARRYLGGQF